MEIRLRPELEEWLAAHRTEIESKINEGYAAAQRRELLTPIEVRARLSERKRVLLAKQ